MLKTKEVVVILNSANIEFYMNKEYDIPKIKNKWGDITTPRGASILVKVEDLSEGAKVLVDVECDGCDTLLEGLKWQTYKKCVKEDGKYYCYKCAHNHYERFISFYQWCYDNLPKELAYYILSRWDYKLNIDKNGRTLSPKDVSFTSNGINRKGYWFKCLEHPEHISEQKRISNFVNENGSIACIQCNTVSITHPYLSLFLVNKEDAYKYSFSSHNELPMKCPRCSHEKKISFNRLTTQGFSCDKCGDGVSFSEKVLFNVFEQLLDKDFQTQLSKTTFEWCKDYKYDFYIKKMNGIICECQGIQHYEETKGNWGSLEDVQENDRDKENLANKNEIENYILLDCRESNLKWIMNSIMNSKLPKLLNFKKSDIDWKICEEFAYSSMIENACNLWNNGDNVVKTKIIKKYVL